MKEIKKCPFCGGNHLDVSLINVEHTNHDTTIPEYVVRNAPPAIRIICRNCLASMIKTFGVKDERYSEIKVIEETTDELIDKWNNRVQDAGTQLKAERLNRLDEWEKELDDREDSLNKRENEIKEKQRNAQSLENWRNQLDFKEKYLERRDLAIGEKLQRYLELRDELSTLLENVDHHNNQIYKQVSELLNNTEGEDGDAPLEMLNLTLSTIKNSKNDDKKE